MRYGIQAPSRDARGGAAQALDSVRLYSRIDEDERCVTLLPLSDESASGATYASPRHHTMNADVRDADVGDSGRGSLVPLRREGRHE